MLFRSVVAEGPSFRGAPSPSPIPVPPPVSTVPAQGVAFPSLGTSPGLEPSSEGSFESAQPVVTELVEIAEIPEIDLSIDDADAKALSDRMDAEVRSRLLQRCKSRQHPEHFLPYPKGHEAC